MNWLTRICIASLCLLTACVSYSFKGSLPSHLQSISIPLFQDQSNPPWVGLQEDLTNAVTNSFVDDNSLRVIENETEADLVLHATILGVQSKTTSVSSDAVVAEKQLEVRVKVECVNKHAEKPLWSGTIAEFGVISGDAGLTEMDNAIAEATEKIVERILNNTIAAW